VVANRGVLFRPKFPAKFRSRRTAAVVSNSRTVRTVLERSGIPGAKIHVVYNAVHAPSGREGEGLLPGLREELGVTGAGPVIGAVGGARPEKGFLFLVEAAPRILAECPDARFVLVGAGVERFSHRLRELGVEHAFRLPGYRTDAVRIMELFSLFVIPSVGMESCPNVLLEAMSLGLPTVGADTGGIAEVIVDGATGRVVARGDANALAGAVLEVLGDPGRAARWGAAGRERVASEFSVEAKVTKTLRVYRGVLAP
jgi:glycosyltransferase involved in cell wall biosynthesis